MAALRFPTTSRSSYYEVSEQGELGKLSITPINLSIISSHTITRPIRDAPLWYLFGKTFNLQVTLRQHLHLKVTLSSSTCSYHITLIDSSYTIQASTALRPCLRASVRMTADTRLDITVTDSGSTDHCSKDITNTRTSWTDMVESLISYMFIIIGNRFVHELSQVNFSKIKGEPAPFAKSFSLNSLLTSNQLLIRHPILFLSCGF